MKPYPVMMNLENKQVLVVGGGRVALRKVTSLLECGAKVSVVSPELDPDLQLLAEREQITVHKIPFEDTILDSYPDTLLVFGTTNSRNVNIEIYNSAAKRKIPCNIADVPDLCTFIVPAVIMQGDLMIAVSTGGSSPALARRIREDLSRRFGPEYAEMTRLMAELRKRVLAMGSSSDSNKQIFLDVVDSQLLEAIKSNDTKRALEILQAILPPILDAEAVLKTASDSQCQEQ